MEIGWKIFDFQGRQLVRHTDFDLKFEQSQDLIQVKGSLNYESHKVDLSQVLGAFNRRERFVDISENRVGLIPDSYENKTLDSLKEVVEIANDKVTFKRQ